MGTATWAYQLENEKSKVWWFPLIMLVWANTHGAFIVGFIIWGAHVAGWLWKYLHKQSRKEVGVKLAIIGAASFAVTLINPASWHLWGYCSIEQAIGEGAARWDGLDNRLSR